MFNKVDFARGLVGFLLLTEQAVGVRNLFVESLVNIEVDAIHAVCRPGLQVDLVDDVLVYIHQRVSRFLTVRLTAYRFLEDVLFGLHADLVIAEPPPGAQFAVKDE